MLIQCSPIRVHTCVSGCATYDMCVFVGRYRCDRLTEAVRDLSARLGPIFRLRLGAQDVVVTTDAEDARTMYATEGRLPRRPTFPALLRYRLARYGTVGIVPSDGPEWHQYRAVANRLLAPDLVRAYQLQHQDIARAFVRHVRMSRSTEGVLQDVYTHLLQFTIEGNM